MIRKALCATILLAVCAWAQPPLGYTITTVAGNGTAGFAGDGGDANAAQINSPSSLALDSSGNLIIADQLNSRIRKITGTTISTVAGKGDNGYFGDTGQATSAGLSYPQGVAVDTQGNIYIADSPNHGIRKVASGGIITTVAGGSFAAYDGDGGPATSAHINFPQGIAVDAAGNFYFSDSGNLRIRKVTTDGKITTIAGNGSLGYQGDGVAALNAFFGDPAALAVDKLGNLYVADTDNGMIRKIDLNGIITTVAGTGTNGYSGDGGSATKAMLNHPKGVAVDSNGLVYIADTYNSRIRVVSTNGTISTIAGNGYLGESVQEGGPALNAILKFPAAVAVTTDGRVYVADTQNNKIRLLTPKAAAAPTAPPTITSGGVVTAGSYGGSAAAAPGSWIEIFGTNFSTASREWTAAEFSAQRGPQNLDGTRVTIGGRPAYVAYISPGQINAQVPSDVGTGPQAVTVTTAAGTSNAVSITMNTTQPGLLAPSSFRVGGRQYAVAILPDGRSYALPVASLGTPTRPAKPGETIILFGVGFGPVSPTVLAGDVAQTAARLTSPLQVLIGGTPAAVSYAGLAPGAVGLYQFNVVVPQIADNDAVPVTLTLGGTAGTQTLFIAVRR
jgi:uncharacterized protein (TIGR03437 family)